MIPLKEFQTLSLALPKCGITEPDEAGCSWIVDREGLKVGDINWQLVQITIYDEYRYADEVVESIGKDKFTTSGREFDISLPEENKKINQI